MTVTRPRRRGRLLRQGGRRAVHVALLLALLLAVIPRGGSLTPHAAHAASTSPITYAYDANGRLSGVIDPSGNAASYHYDAVGNITAITPQSATVATVLAFAPLQGPAGTRVTLTGAGFSSTALSNTVTFNGATAVVAAARPAQLVVTVPAGATSGPIHVTTPTGSATSSTSFTVRRLVPPAISGVGAAVVTSGSPITLTGSGFDPTPSHDIVRLNGTIAQVITSTANALVAIVPPATGSGRLSVTTPGGSMTTPWSVFVPPSPYTPDQVALTGRLTNGQSQPITITTAGQIALLSFDGRQGQQVSLGLSGATLARYTVALYSPDIVQLGLPTGLFQGAGVVGPVTLPYNGTYTFVVDSSTNTGSVGLTLYQFRPVAGTLSPGGPAVPVTITIPAQTAALTFTGRAGAQVSLEFSKPTFAGTVALHTPYNSSLASTSVYSGSDGFLDTVTLPLSGTYTLLLTPLFGQTGSVTLHLYSVQDQQGTIVPNGPAIPVTTTVPGQNASLTFSGTTGQQISLTVFTPTLPNNGYGYVRLFAPDHSQLAYQGISTVNSLFFDALTLQQTGTYTVTFDPYSAATGTASLQLYTFQDAQGTIVLNGPAVPVTTTIPGQNATLTFSGTAGQQVSLNVFTPTFSTNVYGTVGNGYVRLYAPDHSQLASQSISAGSGTFFDALTLQKTGGYTVTFDPASSAVGTASMQLYAFQDVQGTIVPNGPAVPVTTTIPGQNAALTFSGTAGQQVSLTVFTPTLSSNGHAFVTLYAPDHSYVTSQYVASGSSAFLGPVTLQQTGPYTITIDPAFSVTGTASVQVYAFQDVQGTIVPNGPAALVTTTIPGQNASLTFSGTSGQQISLNVFTPTLSTNGSGSSVRLSAPDHSQLASQSISAGSGTFFDALTLQQTGAYTITIDPASSATGSVSLQLYAFQDVQGAIVPNGPAVPVTITAPGQNASLTFSGATGQQISLTVFTPTLSNMGHGVVTLYAPGHSYVTNRYVSSGSSASLGPVTLQQTGPYTIAFDPASSVTGTATITLSVLSAQLVLGGANGGLAAPTAASPTPASLATATLASGPPLPTGTGALSATAVATAGTSPPPLSTTSTATLPLATSLTPSVPIPALLPGNVPALHAGHRTQASVLRPARSRRAALTALMGQVRDVDGQPLRNVSVSIGRHRTRTNRAGDFVLTALPAGYQVLLIDGHTANHHNATYGLFQVRVRLVTGRITALPYVIWLPRLDTAHSMWVSSPTTHAVTLTSPRIPGLKIIIPKGAVIHDAFGHIVHRLSLTRIPSDRPPFPMPQGEVFPVYFTVQPGGASVTPGRVQVIYPNAGHMPPGTRLPFWGYEPRFNGWSRAADQSGWTRYGYGHVTADGRSVVPDRGVYFDAFTGAGNPSDDPPPPNGPPPHCICGGGSVCGGGGGDSASAGDEPQGPSSSPGPGAGYGGDPVDLATGLEVLHHTDLVLPDVIPIAITRTYRQGDPYVRFFGPGQTLSYALFLDPSPDTLYQQATLILPDGGQVHYARVSPGTDHDGAVFQSTSSPSIYYRSLIWWTGLGWSLRFTDGTVFQFTDFHTSGYHALLTAIQDRAGNSVHVVWDRYHIYITAIKSPNGRWIQFTYSTYINEPYANGTITHVSDDLGRVVTYGYSSVSGGGDLLSVTDARGGVTSYTYDGNNNLGSITDPRGITYLTNAYDSAGRVVQQTLADGSTYHFAYTTNGTGGITTVSVTDPRGNVRQVTLDAAGYVTSDTRAAGSSLVQTYTYVRQAGSDLVQNETDPLGRQTTYSYDTNGNVTRLTQLAGTAQARTYFFTYDPLFSQITRAIDPLGHTTTHRYDSVGNLVATTDALGQATTYRYNAQGEPVSITDPLTHTTVLTYTNGDPVAASDALGRTATQFVDAGGRILLQSDPLQDQARLSFDNLNNLTAMVNPLGNATVFSYDADANLASMTDAAGHRTSFSYDSRDRVISRTDPLSRTETYAYDGNNNLISFTDRKGQQTRSQYDALDRLVQRTYADTSTTTWSYDAGNRLTQAVDSRAGTIVDSYDGLDRLTHEVSAQGALTYTYDLANRRTSMAVSGQQPLSYTYDAADRLTTINQGSATVGYGYDAANRMLSLTLPDGIAQNYGYDAASELDGITYAKGGATLGTLTYRYDPNGQVSTVGGSWARITLPQTVSSAAYDADNELTHWGSQTLSYDANGNLTGDGTTIYAWNAHNQLVGISENATARFLYDAFGRRVSKSVAGTSTSFLYDGPNVVQELTGSTPSANLLAGLGIDRTYLRTSGGQVTTLLTDALGSILALADSAGTVRTQYTYDPFGNTTVTGTASTNAFQYTGRENDGTGLYYNRARYYSPNLQRFISEDPIGFAGSSSNLYAYAGDNPLGFNDPSGLVPNPAELACFFGPNPVTGPICAGGVVVDGVTSAAAIAATVAAAAVGIIAWATEVFKTQEEEKQEEYEEAKKWCDTPPPQGGNPCATLSKQIGHAARCISLYEAWDAKWMPGRHAQKIAEWRNRLQNLKDEHNRGCT